MKIYAIKMERKINYITFNRFLSYVDQARKKKIKKFMNYEDAQRTLLGDILIRSIIINKFKLKNKKIIFTKNKYGKPIITILKDFHFNISHSGDWIVCVVDSKEIGIDIEKIKPIDFEIINNFFSKEERTDFFNKSENEKQSYFYKLWTLKESYTKAVGKGLSIPLDSFTIRILDEKIRLETCGEKKKYFFKQYHLEKKYIISVCASNNNFPDKIIIKNIKELFDEINI